VVLAGRPQAARRRPAAAGRPSGTCVNVT
jgi:hypothetical protein